MKPIIIANWKMNLPFEEAISKAKQLNTNFNNAKFILAPPALYIGYIAKEFPKIVLSAQDLSSVNGYGSYTGEISADILKSCGVDYAIIGHSEKRNLMKDSNMTVKKKAENCIKTNITPIICIGETLEARKNNNYKDFILEQAVESIAQTDKEIILAYEPIWAIGTGITPKKAELEEIFNYLSNNKDISSVAKNIKLVYGGSVNSQNHKEILSIDNINGVLLGSAALDDDELKSILNNYLT